MKETILLYNIKDKKIRGAFQLISVRMKVRIRVVDPSQYQMPVGLLAFGSPDEQKEYLSESAAAFDDPMLIFAGFSNKKLNDFLSEMSKKKIPKIALKAVLTEHNAVWNSIALHDELAEEHSAVRSAGQTKTSGQPS